MNDFFLSDITCRLPEGTQAIGEVLMGALGPYMLFYCPEDHTFLDRATLRDVLESPLSFGLCAMTQESLRGLMSDRESDEQEEEKKEESTWGR